SMKPCSSDGLVGAPGFTTTVTPSVSISSCAQTGSGFPTSIVMWERSPIWSSGFTRVPPSFDLDGQALASVLYHPAARQGNFSRERLPQQGALVRAQLRERVLERLLRALLERDPQSLEVHRRGYRLQLLPAERAHLFAC